MEPLEPDDGELVGFRRTAGLPGIEVLDAQHTRRNWRVFNTAFALATPTSWCGEVVYRQRRAAVTPGIVFPTEPGEVHTTPRVHRPGSFHVLFMDPAVLRSHLAEHDIERDVHWTEIAHRMSPLLTKRLIHIIGEIGSEITAMELQADFVDLVDCIATELLDTPRRSRALDVSAGAAEQIRACIHDEADSLVDLEDLARKTGLSRFQVLRTFKRRYGMPPHAYRLCVRIWQSRSLLVSGTSAAEVAATLGFADQSHFIRHFKRILGVTPQRYLDGSAGSRRRFG